MHKIAKQSMIFFVIATLLLTSFGSVAMAHDPSYDEEISAEKMLADFFLVRPLGIAATIFGTVFFVVSSPFSALGGNTQEVFEKTMAEPAAFTFKRPLGQL
ncbi:MAG: hypothetical protein JRI28_04950 [Deltaproteobacteria bacterium]|nr:hypothetical protein [Deltaproteobacteria bacterium]